MANTSRSARKDFDRQGPGRLSQRRRRAGLSSTAWRVLGAGGGVANGDAGTGLISTAEQVAEGGGGGGRVNRGRVSYGVSYIGCCLVQFFQKRIIQTNYL
ncbi:hypothetical protein S83_037723 [Arachis hypogaea]|nr:uncharacterized protein DS421_12g356020 [Arachis hypogaea]